MGLIKLCKSAVTAKTASGHLPIHLACLYSESVGILRSLLHLYPQSASIDLWGQLPLHLVVEHGGDVNANQRVAMLQRFYPAASRHYDNNGSLPIQICRSGALAKVLACHDPQVANIILQRTVAKPGHELEYNAVLQESVAKTRVFWANGSAGSKRLTELLHVCW